MKPQSRLFESDTEFELTLSTALNEPMAILHKQIFAMTICPQTLRSQRSISTLNRIISNSFHNAFCNLVLYKGRLFLKLGSQPLLDLTDEEFITLQGRSFDDFCLKIINLSQNYRWVTSHHYNKA